ncbi:MAG TPA: hypothetical protein VF627_12805 [Abditibacterium sp.]|jgi:uncharacterized Tic20 family protein
MHKIWIYPLFFGLVGAAYPVICAVEAVGIGQFLLTATTVKLLGISTRTIDWGQEISRLFWDCFSYGFGAGALLGLYAAWRDKTRGAAVSQSNEQVATRLLSNVAWLLVYALLFLGSMCLAAWGVAQARLVSPQLLRYGLPALFASATGLVNLFVIVWAARRTAHTDDILNPRVALAKLKASTEMTPRKRKPSRHDAQV